MNVTGTLDNSTMAKMASPRCGLPDYILAQPASLNLNSNSYDKKKIQTSKNGPAAYQAGWLFIHIFLIVCFNSNLYF